MAEDSNSSDSTGSGIAPFDEKGCLKWKQGAKIALMRMKRAHLGLEAAPHLPANHPTAAQRLAHEAWYGRNDMAFSLIVGACAGSAEATLVCDSYYEATEEAVRPDNALPDWEKPPTLARELMTRLMFRFEGHTQERLAGYLSDYSSMVVKDNETATVMIDRLQFLILKLTQLGQEPTQESRKEKLKAAIKVKRLKELVGHIAMQPDLASYDDLCAAVKKWDKAFENLEVQTPSVNSLGGQMPMAGKGKRRGAKQDNSERSKSDRGKGNKTKDKYHKTKAACKHCNKPGHHISECWIKKREDEEAAKVASKAFRKRDKDKQREAPSEKKKKKSKKNIQQLRQSNSNNWGNKKVKVDDIDEDSADDSGDSEASMISDMAVEVNQVDASNKMFVDTCASTRLLIVIDANELDHVEVVRSSINLTRAGASMNTEGVGRKNAWDNISVCPDSVKNICSLDRLKEAGYGLKLLEENWIVNRKTEEKILLCTTLNGMPYVDLYDFFNLPDLTQSSVPSVHLSDNVGLDPLDLLHARTGCVSQPKLLEAHRLRLFTDSGLTRGHLSKKAKKRIDKYLCKHCARAKMTRTSFSPRDT
jgi:hypothetical protein